MTDLSGAVWRKSTRSGQQGACVELASIPGLVAVRDSKNPSGPVLRFRRPAVAALMADVKVGTHDL
jgi:hypothetical protein